MTVVDRQYGAPSEPRGRLPAWPLFALLVLFPLWWFLGLSTFIFPILAVPMAVFLLRRRPVKVPPGFLLWALFLVWVVAGGIMLGVNPPGTVAEPASGRVVAYSLRTINYFAVTVIFLYAGNLTERELPRLRLVRMLGALFLTTLIGGLVGILFPDLQLRSPVASLLPGSLASDDFVQRLVTPSVAQVQEVLGYGAPRPTAPFEYTNAWGNNLSILMVWFVLGWLVYGSSLRRTLGVPLLLLAVIPVTFSLNRGLWIGLLIAVVYVAVRLALRGKPVAVAGIALALVAGAAIFTASPLQDVVVNRLQNQHSNEVRTSLTQEAIKGATRSPAIGFGSTRAVQGGRRSVAVGRTDECAQCGNAVIGSNGHLWLLIFSNGFVGAALYVGFFLQAIARFWRDSTPLGIAGGLAITLPMFYMLVYGALVSPLCIYLISLALLWRNDMERRRTPALLAAERTVRPGLACTGVG
jgi:O-antigen ligase